MDILTFRRIGGGRIVDFGWVWKVYQRWQRWFLSSFRIDAPLWLMVKVLGRFLSSSRLWRYEELALGLVKQQECLG
jgi:hypothetical protein